MLTFLCRNLFCFLILLACCLETEVASVDVVNLGGKNVIEKDIRDEYAAIMSRLKSAEGVKLAIL